MLHLEPEVYEDDVSVDEGVDEPWTRSSGGPRSVADFRAARQRRKVASQEAVPVKQEDDEEMDKLRWLPLSGQAHLVPLIKESRKLGSIDDGRRIPLTEETILEVDSSSDLDFG
jgi:hypothetical protein